MTHATPPSPAPESALESATPENQTAQVWDIWVRLFHWGLVLAIATAALTGFLANATWLRLHLSAGLVAAGLVLARIVWGFTGTTHARFADFVPSVQSLRTHLSGKGHRHLGHNPLGGLMVLALIALVLMLALSGLVVLGGLLRTGPLAASFGTDSGFALREMHEVMALVLLGLIGLHLGGVVFESRRAKENLVRAMVTGRKPRRKGDVRPALLRPRGALALVAIGALAGGLALSNAQLSHRALPGQPEASIAPAVAEECGACHMVYHPALLPAQDWRRIMTTLGDHFGEDASLPEDTAAEITDWLTVHASDNVETKAARLFARPAPEAIGLTDRPVWKRLHADLPEALFATPAVRNRSNCAACHGDAASGHFSPFSITIPKETN